MKTEASARSEQKFMNYEYEYSTRTKFEIFTIVRFLMHLKLEIWTRVFVYFGIVLISYFKSTKSIVWWNNKEMPFM